MHTRKIAIDTHVHTEGTSPYMKGDSNLKPYHEAAKNKGLAGVAITDHFHYFWQDHKYVRLQREHIEQANYKDPVMLLGVEQTILGRKGHVHFRKSHLKYLDFMNISVHWITGLNGSKMNGAGVMKIVEKILAGRETGWYLVSTYFNYINNALYNEKIKGIPKIASHVFYGFIERGFFHPKVLNYYDVLFENLKDTNSFFEVNGKALDAIYDQETFPVNHPDLLEKEEFLSGLANIAKTKGVKLATGSDAHRLGDIGKFSEKFLERNGIGRDLIVGLEDLTS
ncbi:MAG: PHP domain-containing protein [Candidatus Hodarchaeota archaeon]